MRAGVRRLCEGDFRAPLRLEVWEAAGGRCTLAGSASTNLRALQSEPRLPLHKDGQARSLAGGLLFQPHMGPKKLRAQT